MTQFNTLRCYFVWLLSYIVVEAVEHLGETVPHAVVPWEPSNGLALAGLFLAGPRFLPVILVGEVVGGWVFCMTPETPIHFLWDELISILAWGGAAWFLKPRLKQDLPTQQDLFLLLAVSAAAALFHALSQGLEPLLEGGLAETVLAGNVLAATWVSDMIGIATLAPFALLAHAPLIRPSRRQVVEGTLQAVLTLGVLALNFLRMAGGGLQLFYLLFLPSIWVATRFGLRGAAIIGMVVQFSIAIGMTSVNPSQEARTAYQLRMLALTITTLFLGAAVSQRRRVEGDLLSRQEQMARNSRLSVAGEMAAAMAHELNQPLTATVSFARAAQRLLTQPDLDREKIRAAMDGAAAQAERAAAIIRTLREFIGQGQMNVATLPLEPVLLEALRLARQECDAGRVRMDIQTERGLPRVPLDVVQIQQVVINLVRNAVDAISAVGREGRVVVSARAATEGGIEIEVADNGPGMPTEVASRIYQPFTSTKATGMGLGLAISRTIIEAHGGRLWLSANGPGGCVFRFILPAEKNKEERGAA